MRDCGWDSVVQRPLRQRAHHRLVLAAVAEEDIVWEFVGHLRCGQFVREQSLEEITFGYGPRNHSAL